MSVITIEQMKNKSTTEVNIIGFEKGEQITLRLKRISLLGLVKSGKIPNKLLTDATELFETVKDKENKEDKEDKAKDVLGSLDGVSNISKILEVVCEEAMIEPKYQEVSEYLTDDQKMEIFNWTQGGVADLETFREKPRDIGLTIDEQDVQSTPESVNRY
jgi:hypothetical protein